MITTLLTIIGGGLGGALRFVPEIFKLFTDKSDRDHEFRMSELQLRIGESRGKNQLDLVKAQGEVAVNSAEMQAFTEAVKAQGKPSGVAWVDALSASVRPVITYWWMLLFTVYKGLTVYIAIAEFVSLNDFAAKLWTAQDAGVLAMILGFWFVDRSIRKNTGL
ncbi:MAG: hypothetical protein R8M11_02345 [Gallionella sp.]